MPNPITEYILMKHSPDTGETVEITFSTTEAGDEVFVTKRSNGIVSFQDWMPVPVGDGKLTFVPLKKRVSSHGIDKDTAREVWRALTEDGFKRKDSPCFSL